MRIGVLASVLAFFVWAGLAHGEEPKEDPAARKARIAAAREALAKAKADFDDRVNKAIERGAAWLKGQQRKDGSYPGFSDDLGPRQYNIMEGGVQALVVLTLAHCGVDPKDPAIKKGMQAALKNYGVAQKNGKPTIYVAATLIMALDALHRPKPKKGQEVGPRFDRYGNPIPGKKTKGKPCKYPSSAKSMIKRLVKFIVSNQESSGGWRYPGNPLQAPEGDTDLSNTQYAMLALDTASRCGIDIPPETWIKAAGYLIRTQETDGIDTPVWLENEAWEPGTKLERFLEATQARARGWAYMPGGTELPTGSMTCAGVTCLALAKERLWVKQKLDAKLRKRIDKALIDGLAWLSEYFTVQDNPTPGGASMWHYYYLYGLERTGVKVGTRWIGKNDWYRVGGEYLLSAQEKHGGWAEAASMDKPADKTESAITQTCFALLFLRRSTRAPEIPTVMPPIVTPEGGGAPKDGR